MTSGALSWWRGVPTFAHTCAITATLYELQKIFKSKMLVQRFCQTLAMMTNCAPGEEHRVIVRPKVRCPSEEAVKYIVYGRSVHCMLAFWINSI